MNADDLKKLTATALERLAHLLDQGRSEELTLFLQAMARFHRYSIPNVCAILAQRPTATHVAGFRTWRSLGRYVRKGEKGIAILAPIIRLCRDDDEEAASSTIPETDREPESDDELPPVRVVRRFRIVYVFDLAQTEGQPLPEPASAQGDPGIGLARIKAAIVAQGIALEYANHLQGALGLSCGGRIRILNGLSVASEFRVLAHEFAHELLHKDAARPDSLDTRELEAEAVAFVVGETIGLDLAAASRDYIHLYRGDADALRESLARIQRAAARILSAIEAAPCVPNAA